MISQLKARDMISDLLQIESGLSDWEVDFVDSVDKNECDLSEKQRGVVEKLYIKHCIMKNSRNRVL